MRSRAEISMIPHPLIPRLWPQLAPYVERGAVAAGMTAGEALNMVAQGRAEMWLLAMAGRVVGAFLTVLDASEAGRRFVGVVALAGDGARAWARLARDTVIDYGRAHGCEAARFHGRRAWLRFFPDFQQIGERHGVGLYERAI